MFILCFMFILKCLMFFCLFLCFMFIPVLCLMFHFMFFRCHFMLLFYVRVLRHLFTFMCFSSSSSVIHHLFRCGKNIDVGNDFEKTTHKKTIYFKINIIYIYIYIYIYIFRFFRILYW